MSKVLRCAPLCSDSNRFRPAGRAAAQLSALGFETLINLKRDFYADIENGRTPSHHVLLTNPPYSGEHKEKLFSYILDSYAAGSSSNNRHPLLAVLAHIQPELNVPGW